jgi:transposase
MDERLDAEIGQLSGLTMAQLRERYRERFPDEFGTTHRQYLVRRIAWRLQAAIYGGLSEAALHRALEIADETELKGRSPSSFAEVAKGNVAVKKQPRKRRDLRLPPLGTELIRICRDRTVIAIVATNGFLYEGQTYRSLSAIARAATGARWNGLLFFGRAKRGDAQHVAASIDRQAKDAA